MIKLKSSEGQSGVSVIGNIRSISSKPRRYACIDCGSSIQASPSSCSGVTEHVFIGSFLVYHNSHCEIAGIVLESERSTARRWRSGQSQQTVNLSTQVYVGSNPTLPKFIELKMNVRALSSFGRAPRLHRGGEEFESPSVHH